MFHRLATVNREQRQQALPGVIGIDEFAVLRRHQCHTVITDLNGRCTHEILEGRSKQTIRNFLKTIPEYKTLANTMLAWRTEILAYFLYPYTNGFTEGTKTKIKLLKRIGYGIPSFQKLRNRILSYK
ncbi:MAG TPA: transposase [Bacilli bacterium]|nr:transposase [Bacilli bacterium]